MKNGRISPLPHRRKFVRWGGGSLDRDLVLQLEQVCGFVESFLRVQYCLRVVEYTQPIIVAQNGSECVWKMGKEKNGFSAVFLAVTRHYFVEVFVP